MITNDVHYEGVRQKWDVIGRTGWGVSKCSGRPIFIFFIKENSIWAMTKDHANNILLTRNLSFDSGVRQWSYPLMIPLHCLWAKQNAWSIWMWHVTLFLFCFCFDFLHSYAQCSCCSIVCLRFHDVHIKRLITKWVLKMWIIINKKHFVVFLDNCRQKNIKPRKSR